MRNFIFFMYRGERGYREVEKLFFGYLDFLLFKFGFFVIVFCCILLVVVEGMYEEGERGVVFVKDMGYWRWN